MGALDSIIQILTPKKAAKAGGQASTPTYNSQNPTQVLTVPIYREHLSDVFTSRQSNNSQDLLQELFRHDPDVSAALHGYLTLANTPLMTFAKTVEGEIDDAFSRSIHTLILKLTQQTDYTLGFQLKENLSQLCANLRYLALLRGAIGIELVFDKKGIPDSLRLVDPKSLRWKETKPGEHKPEQTVSGQTAGRSLDQPTFFVSFYRRDPTSLYTYGSFVSAINTIAARQQVMNDLYRIMTITGFPRMEITVLEEAIRERAPENIKREPNALKTYVNDTMAQISSQFTSIRVDQAITHSDTIAIKILNEKNPGVGVDISKVIETLNAQNQAGLKTMSTMLGRGASGVNTGSVEARIAAMFADELNEPIAELLMKVFSYCLHQDGFQGFSVVNFAKAELRPETELEPQMALKTSRLRQDLSDGIISDVEYTLSIYRRLPLPGAPRMSGTGFMAKTAQPAVDPNDVSPNTDPLGRAVSPDGKTKQNKSPPKKSVVPPQPK